MVITTNESETFLMASGSKTWLVMLILQRPKGIKRSEQYPGSVLRCLGSNGTWLHRLGTKSCMVVFSGGIVSPFFRR